MFHWLQLLDCFSKKTTSPGRVQISMTLGFNWFIIIRKQQLFIETIASAIQVSFSTLSSVLCALKSHPYDVYEIFIVYCIYRLSIFYWVFAKFPRRKFKFWKNFFAPCF